MGKLTDIMNMDFPGRRSKRRAKHVKYEKAPGAPKRFKSAYIFFSTEKHPEIRAQLGASGVREKTTNVAKLVSEAWKNLTPQEREKYEEMARLDKERYEIEKSNYEGPWHVVKKRKRRSTTDAPKRPQSAFIMFSNMKRPNVIKQDPELNNEGVSNALSEMWRNAPEEEKRQYIQLELEQRRQYREQLDKWRVERDEIERRKTSLELENTDSPSAASALSTVATQPRGMEPIADPPSFSAGFQASLEQSHHGSAVPAPTNGWTQLLPHLPQQLEEQAMASFPLQTNVATSNAAFSQYMNSGVSGYATNPMQVSHSAMMNAEMYPHVANSSESICQPYGSYADMYAAAMAQQQQQQQQAYYGQPSFQQSYSEQHLMAAAQNTPSTEFSPVGAISGEERAFLSAATPQMAASGREERPSLPAAAPASPRQSASPLDFLNDLEALSDY